MSVINPPTIVPRLVAKAAPIIPQAQLENKDIIEYDIDNGRYGVAHHGIVGRSVQADVKHAGA